MTILLYMSSKLDLGQFCMEVGFSGFIASHVHGRFLAGFLGSGVLGRFQLYASIATIRF